MSSGFITESEIAEKRKCRQEEWEKVRRPDQPLEAPEEEYDHRSLFDRLQEQKQKRDYEYEEAHRLKNMIKGLDDDEVEFLDLVDRSKLAEERKQRGEEARELASYRSAVASLHQHTHEQRIRQEMSAPPPVPKATTGTSNSSYTSQTKLLAGAVVKKRPGGTADQKQTSSPPSSNTSPPTKKAKTQDSTDNAVDKKSPPPPASTESEPSQPAAGLQCIGILPGISYSESSSDSASSSEDDDDHGGCGDGGCHSSHQHVDMIGRKLVMKQKVASESE